MPSPLLKLVFKVFMERGQKMRASQFEQHQISPGDIVFLGDSITEGGLWQEWFPGIAVKNRGIGGDTTSGVLARMHTATTSAPAAVFLLIGTNDLTMGVNKAEISSNVREILDRLKSECPDSAVFLQSVMPRGKKDAPRVQSLNELYSDLAAEYGATWVDLWPALADSDGSLKSTYTLDKLHLTGEGYAAWVSVLRPHVEKYRPNPKKESVSAPGRTPRI